MSFPGIFWLQSGAAGFDNPPLLAALARGICLTNDSAPATAIAEHVFANLLDHFQGGAGRRADRADKRWRPAGTGKRQHWSSAVIRLYTGAA